MGDKLVGLLVEVSVTNIGPLRIIEMEISEIEIHEDEQHEPGETEDE